MKRRFLIFIIVTLSYPLLPAQNKAEMSKFQLQLNQLFDQVYNAPTDNERYLANESAVHLLSKALEMENSFKWKWDLGTRVSVLTASDGKFRIFSWPVRRDNGEYECFGFVQAYDEGEEEWVVTVLHDKSDEIINPEESILAADQWLGAVYQSLVETSHGGHHYYMLLGWTGVDMLTQRKVIEPIWFKRKGAAPLFGQPVFRRDGNRRRVILCYSNNAMVNLRYEVQFTRQIEKKRVKVKGSKKPVIEQINHDEKQRMIIFDEVAPQVPGMEGLFQYYVPSGVELAYVFMDGKWALKDNAQGRLADKKLNKEFAPIDKPAPQYRMQD
ncbi:MAG: hypothetical protein IJ764_06855 [Bacteroidales bacterium]|nr:hypothetical protein [Bacteroidales bacterium]